MNNPIEPLEVSIRKLRKETLRKDQRDKMSQRLIDRTTEDTNRNYSAFTDRHTASAYRQIKQDHRTRNKTMINATTSSPPEVRLKRKMPGSNTKVNKDNPSPVTKKKIVQESQRKEPSWTFILEQLGKSRFNPKKNRYWGTQPKTLNKLKENKEYDRYIDSL